MKLIRLFIISIIILLIFGCKPQIDEVFLGCEWTMNSRVYLEDDINRVYRFYDDYHEIRRVDFRTEKNSYANELSFDYVEVENFYRHPFSIKWLSVHVDSLNKDFGLFVIQRDKHEGEVVIFNVNLGMLDELLEGANCLK